MCFAAACVSPAILAGIESGQLGKSLESLVDTAGRMDHLRRVTGLALLYPIIIIVLTAFLFAMVVSVVVPNFNWLNESHFGVLAWLAQWPQAVQIASLVIACVVPLAAAVWWFRSGRLPPGRPSRFGLLAWIPGTRNICRWSQAATFSEMLLLLVESSVPLDHALQLVADAIDDAPMRQRQFKWRIGSSVAKIGAAA